ncbi:PorT family protein [Neolewinella aurantiaca]|uniref:PorT family protein n=1 Tax=Neolewinella aurantiaca TaxID=2602767 RepID=A0A5C7FKJ1_9BACT|nr:outer membrane beta-barrel protein [Neolewinella aurantiaca]TXF91203.1 PorT family protein [Neolewinella aurantiaca]
MKQLMQPFTSFLLITVLCTCGPAQNKLCAQLRLTIDGGVAVANFDHKPVLPSSTQQIFGLTDGQSATLEPLESGYVGIAMAHHPQGKPWGWSTRLQFMKRGYRFVISGDPSNSDTSLAHSYTSFIDGMAQITTTISGRLSINAGPYLSLALREERLSGPPRNRPGTGTDYGLNAGLSYRFGRIGVTVNYQQSLRQYLTIEVDEAFITASGLSDYVAIQRKLHISALRIGLEYAIWE